MSVLEKGKIDFIGIDKLTGKVVLTISDHLGWEDELLHIYHLQEKVNAYIDFIESGEIYEAFPLAKGKSIVISIVFKFVISTNGIEFLKKVKGSLYDLDIELLYSSL